MQVLLTASPANDGGGACVVAGPAVQVNGLPIGSDTALFILNALINCHAAINIADLNRDGQFIGRLVTIKRADRLPNFKHERRGG